MPKTLQSLGLLFIALILPLSLLTDIPLAKAADNNNLISDAEFINWRTLDATGVQQFLNSKPGTRLRSFSEGGRSAAQIIADAARANGINPIVILSTIQKEEGLVESNYNFDFRVNWAMGYSICDSCSLDDPNVVANKGFTKQVDNGTWQLKYNYSYWAANGSAWNVGKTMIIDGEAIHFSNRATSSLYRYTPHIQSFPNVFNNYKNFRGQGASDSYDAKFISQTPKQNYTVNPGQRFLATVRYKNTGGAVWTKGQTFLGNTEPDNHGSSFTGGGNARWGLLQGSVRKNGVGSFQIWLTAPGQGGTYIEKIRPVQEGVTWMGDTTTFVFTVREPHSAQLIRQTGLTNLKPNQTAIIHAYYKNTGGLTWKKGEIFLGNSSPQDRGSALTAGGNVRWQLMNQTPPNGTGHFQISVTAPLQTGTYTERYRPLREGVTWFGPEATFNFNVAGAPVRSTVKK